MTRPPNDRGQGRKRISPDGELLKPHQIRMSNAEWAKCRRLGGAAWVRDRIKHASEPKAAPIGLAPVAPDGQVDT